MSASTDASGETNPGFYMIHLIYMVDKTAMIYVIDMIDINDMIGPNGNGTLDGVELQTNSGTFSQNPWFAAYNFVNDSEKERG